MKAISRILWILIVMGTFAAGLLGSREITVLSLSNLKCPRAYWVRVDPSERFLISSVHSIYRAPVVEEFQIEQGMIILKWVRARHAGVLEYYGFEDTKEFHPVDRKFGTIPLRVGMGEVQRLWVRGRKISFLEVGERGDPVQLELRTVSLGRYLFHQAFSQSRSMMGRGGPVWPPFHPNAGYPHGGAPTVIH